MSVMAAPVRVPAGRYPAGMARHELMGIRSARAGLPGRVEAAQDDEHPVHTVLVINNEKRGVLVSLPWRRAAAAALGERLDLAAVPLVATTALRDRLGAYVDDHVLAVRRSRPVAALVPWDWYLRAAHALGETIDI